MAKAEKEEVQPQRFSFTLRPILYAIAFFLLFGLTASELGLVSQQLHKYGNSYEHYASMEYKHALGLLLFSVIFSLLLIFSHPVLGVGFFAFWAFIMAVFFGTGAGIIQRTAPFKGTSCGRPADEYPVEWRPYAGECSRIVTIQALAWSLWAMYIFVLVGILVQKLELRARPTPEGFYRSKP